MLRFIFTSLISLIAVTANCQITLVQFSSGFTNPIDVANAGDSRIFVVEQAGRIYIVDSLGVKKTTPFLNIVSRVLSGGERGLLGLAFSPDYASTGYFYVNYTRQPDGYTRISKFRVSSNPDSAVAASEEILLTIYQPFANHNGGNLEFGPDGYLYIAMGDGGSGGDPGNRAQNKDSLLGKMLRIDVSGCTGNYFIPPSNPFIGVAGRDEIWATGLRNPWRWSFDRIKGDLWLGDVGQNEYEEINMQPANNTGGDNYGWRCYEANHPFNTTGCGPMSSYKSPVLEVSQSATGSCAIVGGYVYRGAEYANMFGKYFFTDECNPNIKTLTPNGVGGYTLANLGTLGGNTLVSFGEDKWGEIYVVAYGGIIYKMKGASCQPVAYISDQPIHVCSGSTYKLSTPAGAGFTYSWKLNGGAIAGAASSTYIASQPGTYTVTVTNKSSCTATASADLIFDLSGSNCSVNFNIKAFVEAFYASNNLMTAVLFNNGLHSDPDACDSVIVELRNAAFPVLSELSVKTLMHTNGTISVSFPSWIRDHSYYIVLRHRNSLETWSKCPMLIKFNSVSFDFTQ
jgi:glucose/arabinose dehydrogenase